MSLACVYSYWLTQWCVLAGRPITGLVNLYGCHANTEWYYKWYTFDRLKNRDAIQLRNILICIVLTTWNVVIGRALNTFLPRRSYQTFRLSVASASCFKADSHIECRAHAVPLPYHAAKGLECLSHVIYTVRPCLIHTCHAAPMPSPTMPLRPRHSAAVQRGPVG